MAQDELLSSSEGILTGLRILDLTEGMAGPAATRFLAEYGADVIKVVHPGGDPMRAINPAGFASWNRSKRAVTIDISEPDGLTVLEGYLAHADVVVHDLTPERASIKGLDDAALAQRFPHLIAASVTAYPPGHPDAERLGDEILVQARLGAMDEQQAARPGPMFVRMPFASWGAAYLLAGGIVTRLFERASAGAAHPIHTSLFQGALLPASLYWQRAEAPPIWMAQHTLQRDDHPSNLTIFQCADGRWIHALGGFAHSATLATVLHEVGHEELIGQPVTLGNRAEWATVFAQRPVNEWTDALWAEGVICMPVLEIGEIFTLEQARVNDYAVEVDDARYGVTLQGGFPAATSPRPRVKHGAPWATDDYDAEFRTEGPTAPAVASPLGEGSGATRTRPLAGLRVVDFGAYVAGPMGAQCLADFGADVIKVEPPWGERGRTINQFTGCQRGKRSLAIDMHNPAARPVMERLVASADVVIHNVRESTARRLGIDEAAIRAINPDVVFSHSSAYGLVGPWAEFGAFDPAACALSGWEINISGPGNRPSWLRNSSMDCHTGLALFLGTMLALYERSVRAVAGGTATSLMAVAAMSASETLVQEDGTLAPFVPIDPGQTGTSAYCRIYKASDSWIAVSAATAGQRRAFREALGVGDERELGEAMRRLTVAAAESSLTSRGVPVEVVRRNNRDAFFDAELALETGLVVRTHSKPYGWFECPAGYWSDTDRPLRSAGSIPDIGEHSVEILAELAYSKVEVAELLAGGVISDEPKSAPTKLAQNPITKSLAARDS
jgi:crotonobetainyl-CoA:carnitine CoA-transferase CaiB-like acyl-CoA transferase